MDNLNMEKKPVVVKVDMFRPQTGQHTTVDIIDALVNSFDKSPNIYIV